MAKRAAVLVLGVVALFSTPFLYCQEWRGRGRVEGTVKNEKGEPIAGAKVTLRWGQGGHGGPDLTTDKNGHWVFFGIAGGSWDVDFDAPGYQTKKISPNLNELERNPPIEVRLEPLAKPKTEAEAMAGGQKEEAEAIEKGNAALEAQNYAEARESYLKALEKMPDNSALWMRLAAAYYGERNDSEALKYARRVAERDPDDYTAWRMIADIELQRGNLEAGREALDKVPEDKIKDGQSHYNLGVLLINKKKYVEAEAALSKAVAVQPDLAEAYYYRAIARMQLKKKAEAKADLRKNLELAPSGPDSKDVQELLKSLQ